jgi:hypothetical protein
MSSDVAAFAAALPGAKSSKDAAGACEALASFFWTDVRSLHVSAAAGEQAQLAVLAAMHAHVLHAGMQEKGCCLLMVLHTFVRELPSCHDAALEVLRAHPTEPLVQFRALDLLCALLSHDDAARQRAIVDAGASEAAVAAMRSHLSFARVQKMGCLLLRRTRGRLPGDGAGGVGAGVADGAMDVVLAALRARTAADTLDLVSTALTALCEFVDGDEASALQAVAAGAIPLVLAAMHAHVPEFFVQDCGSTVLCHLANAHASTHIKLADAGAAGILLAAMETHICHAALQHRGCSFMTLPPVVGSMSADDSSRALRVVSAALRTPRLLLLRMPRPTLQKALRSTLSSPLLRPHTALRCSPSTPPPGARASPPRRSSRQTLLQMQRLRMRTHRMRMRRCLGARAGRLAATRRAT